MTNEEWRSLAKSEAFAREVHAMYPDGQLDAFMAEYDRMRNTLDAWGAQLDEQADIIETARNLARTYRRREFDDEKVIDWDLLDLLIAKIRY